MHHDDSVKIKDKMGINIASLPQNDDTWRVGLL